ncbi:MAG: hypothetical protein H7842_05860 [Gammaproteobacteria bacterium SHHR-1]
MPKTQTQAAAADTPPRDDFMQAFRGSFTSALRWHHLDSLWQLVRADAGGGWYLYAIGTQPPTQPASAEQVLRFVDELDALLRQEHDEDYCGIVYADDLSQPGFIKVYDPNNLGVSCGYSDNPPLPGWILCKLPPSLLAQDSLLAKGRQRWWQRLWR